MGSTVYTVHNSFGNYRVRNQALLIPTFACFRRIVCCSPVARDSLPAFFQRLSGERLRVVQNGVDLDRVDRMRGGIHKTGAEAPFTLASISQLIDRKTPLAVLEAFRQGRRRGESTRPDGTGASHDKLVAESRARGIEARVQLTG
jgi:hypothetical protein